MNKQFTLVVALLLCVLMAHAQKGIVKGFVYDNQDGEAISFASVKLDSTTLGAITDDQGFFTITNVPPGVYQVSSSY